MIERAQGQDAQRRRTAGNDGRDLVDAAVTAAGHDQRRTGIDSAARGDGKFIGRTRKRDVRLQPVSLEAR